jgi:hypothetical protein
MNITTNNRTQANSQYKNFLTDYFKQNQRPQLIIRITEIKNESQIDTIIKARNLVRRYPELRWIVNVKPTDPADIPKMKAADASIDSYDKAIQYILAAELKGLL